MNKEQTEKLLELLKRLETVHSREDYEICAECGNINKGSDDWHRGDCELKSFIDILQKENTLTYSEKKFPVEKIPVDIEKERLKTFKPFEFPKMPKFDPDVTYFLPADEKMTFCVYCHKSRIDHLIGDECPIKGGTLQGPSKPKN